MSRIPSYRLHKPSGRAVVTLNGKDHYLGKHGSRESKAAYARLMAEYEAAGKALSFGIEPGKATVQTLVADYKQWAKQYHPKAEYDQISYALRHIENYCDLALEEFSPLKLKAIQATLVKTIGSHGKPLSRKYINATVDRIRIMFRWAASNEFANASLYQALMTVERLKAGRTSAPDRDPIKPVDDKLVEATIVHCTQVVADMIRLQRLTGMRPAEVCQLTPAMVDKSQEVWLVDFKKHKTAWRGKSRLVRFGPKAQAVLIPYLLRSAEQPCFSPIESKCQMRQKRHEARVTPDCHGNAVGTNRVCNPKRSAGDCYSTCAYRRAIWRACEKAFPLATEASESDFDAWKTKYRWSPNQLRHTAGTEARKAFGIEGAQLLLGHSRVTTTQVYAEVNNEKYNEIARRIG